VVVGEPPTDVATMVANPSAKMPRPRYGSRSRRVISLTALTCPAFSAMSAMTAGRASTMKLPWKCGNVWCGSPNQSACDTPLKLVRKCVDTLPVASGAVIMPPALSQIQERT
jgi:hypothetical protein